MPTIIKHGDFSFDDEKIYEIAKDIEVVNKKKAFLGQFFSPNAAINGDRLTKRRQVLLDPKSVANLNEGQTPRKDDIKVVTWSQALRSYGSYIGYSRQAYKKNRDSITDMARRQLVHNRIYDIESTRFAALASTLNVMQIPTKTGGAVDYWKLFNNAKIAARKNRVSGKLVFLCTPEIASAIVDEAKEANSLLAGSAEGASLIHTGYLGDYNGVHIVEYAEDWMYVPAVEAVGTEGQAGYVAAVPAKQLAFFIGHTEDGMWPLVENGLSEGNIEVISKEIGSEGSADPTNERGTIAARIDDVGAFLEAEQCVFSAEFELDPVTGVVNIPAAYKPSGSFATINGLKEGDPTHTYGQGAGIHDNDQEVVAPTYGNGDKPHSQE